MNLIFTPNGKTLVISSNKHIQLWDVATRKELRRYSGFDHGPDNVVISSDGTFLAATGIDHEKPPIKGRAAVRVWDIPTGKLRHEWTGIRGGPNVLALSADGKFLVHGGEGESVRFLDVTTGKQLRAIDSLSMIRSLALSPDSKLLVTASGYQNHQLQVWEVATGAELRRLDLPSEWSRVAFSSDGKLAWGSGGNITVLSEDGIRLSQEHLPAPAELRPSDLEDLWSDLASTDGRLAYRALAMLQAAPQPAVAFLKQRLFLKQPQRRADAPGPEQIARLIADLDSDQFSVHARAARALEEIGGAAKSFLEAKLADKPSLEVQRRVQELLARLTRLEGQSISPQALRILRAVQLLECFGTPEAQRLLEELAQESADTDLVAEAKIALRRLAQRASTPARDWRGDPWNEVRTG